MSRIRTQRFFRRPVLEVAPELLGDVLAIKTENGIERHVITELEAYGGEEDLACHARKGRTPRAAGLYEPGGVFYIYLIYGMYTMLNVVCDRQDEPAGILIRSVESITGPGRLTRDLELTRDLHGKPARRATGVWFEAGEQVPHDELHKTPRIGVEYAGEWARAPRRFVWVSR